MKPDRIVELVVNAVSALIAFAGVFIAARALNRQSEDARAQREFSQQEHLRNEYVTLLRDPLLAECEHCEFAVFEQLRTGARDITEMAARYGDLWKEAEVERTIGFVQSELFRLRMNAYRRCATLGANALWDGVQHSVQCVEDSILVEVENILAGEAAPNVEVQVRLEFAALRSCIIDHAKEYSRPKRIVQTMKRLSEG